MKQWLELQDTGRRPHKSARGPQWPGEPLLELEWIGRIQGSTEGGAGG